MISEHYRIDNSIVDWGQIYRMCLCIWMFILTLDQTYVMVPATLYLTIWMAIKGLLVLKVLCSNKYVYSYRTVLAGLLMVLGLVATKQSQNYGLEAFFWFLAAADGIDVEQSIRALFKIEIAALFLVIASSLLGIIDMNTIQRNEGIYRYSLGFYHPNILACKVLQIDLMYLYLRRRMINIGDLAVVIVSGWVAYLLTNSRTAWLLTILLGGLIVWDLLIERMNLQFAWVTRACVNVLKCIYILGAIISMAFALFYSYDTEGMDTLYSRFSQLYTYFHYYPVRLFGNTLYYHNGAGINPDTGLYSLDNTYMYLLLGFGIVIFALILTLNTMAMFDVASHGDIILLSIFVIYAVYGLAETYGLKFDCNFTLILLYPYIWGNSVERIDQKCASDTIGV